MRARYPHVSTAYLVDEYEAGATCADLAEMTGMNRESIRYRLVNGGATIRPRGHHLKPRGTIEEAFSANVPSGAPDECWEWTGPRLKSGYGTFSHGSFKTTAHRYAVMRQGIAIPAEHEVDHLCFNPPCVNPAHLEVVTKSENRRRQRTRTHCNRGHEFTAENTVTEGGPRRCRTCRQEQRARQRASTGEE